MPALWPVLVLLPLAIYAVVLLLFIRSLQSEDLSSEVLDMAEAAASNVRAELSGGLDLLDLLAASTAIDQLDLPAFRQEAGRLSRTRPGWQTITLSDRERDVLDLRAGILVAAPPIPDVATFERVIATGQRAIAPLRGESITLRVPVVRDGRVRGTLAATLPLTSLAPLALHNRLPAGWLMTVTDDQFSIVARSPAAPHRLGTAAGPEYERLARQRVPRLERLPMPGGGDAWVGMVSIPELQWSVAVWVPASVAQAPLWPLRLVLALGGVWALATALLLAAWMLRRDRRLAEAEAGRLAAEAARAAENDRRKSDFLTTMSHELRTPLTGILGFTDLLASSPLSPQQRQWVEQQRRAGNALLTLVGEVLDLSRIEEGAVELEHIPFDLPATLHDCLNLMRPVAQKKGLGLHAVLQPALPQTVLGDPLRLRQIINNLLSNAIRFTQVGEVRLEAAAEPMRDGRAAVVVTVADTGVGIAPEKLSQVFERFRQADASTQREHGGSGLGLAICQRLVLAMGGTIRADSAPGQGSRFTFRIPLSTPPRARAPQPPAPARVLAAAKPVTESRSLRVLVAEDVLPNQALLRAVLEGGGHAVDIASNGQEAAELAALHDYDVGLLDIRMPVMDGFAAARAIRGLPAPQGELPLIALTADITQAVQNEALAAGFGSVLPKPFEALDLLDSVLEAARPPPPESYVLLPAGKQPRPKSN
ncbi:response regulator [Rhodovarius crocodyli]|uniref:histidine kinase n=2 Tax=Rhodovarius crocodyli TaxID=1979269 RepID=A0A437MII5_9PROT|nr:response regulator [Rhodovarius crocodyli]